MFVWTCIPVAWFIVIYTNVSGCRALGSKGTAWPFGRRRFFAAPNRAGGLGLLVLARAKEKACLTTPPTPCCSLSRSGPS